MCRRFWFVSAVLIVLFTTLLLAGEYGKCTMNTQECLDTMVSKLKEHGWMGIELEIDEVTGTRTVMRVVPKSPAEKAGFQVGDVLVALNGIRLVKEQDEALSKLRNQMKPGSEVTYTVARNSYERQMAVTLAPAPSDVMAGWIGRHMLEHSSTEMAKQLTK